MDATRQRLAGRTCLVTGSASGIGRSIAQLFAREGAHVVCLDRQSDPVEGGATTLRTILDDGGSASELLVDLGRADDVDGAVEQVVRERGRLDVLVNNAAT